MIHTHNALFAFTIFISTIISSSLHATTCQTSGRIFNESDIIWSQRHKTHLYCAGDNEWRYLAQWGLTGPNNIVLKTGKIGIGVDSPVYTLDIAGHLNISNGNAYYMAGKPVLRQVQNALFVGQSAGTSASAGDAIIAATSVGVNSGHANTKSFVSTFGYSAGYNNSGTGQTAVGARAGYGNSGHQQTVVGSGAGEGNNTSFQTAIGYNAGASNTGGVQTALGYYAGTGNAGGYQTALGVYAGYQNTGLNQVAIGTGASPFYTRAAGAENTGSNQTAIGVGAGYKNSAADQTVIGHNAGYENKGTRQTAIGRQAGYMNTGSNLTAIGARAGYANISNDVVAIGYEAGRDNTTPNQFILKQANVSVMPLMQGDFGTGRLGIGTTSPTEKLQVVGSIDVTNSRILRVAAPTVDTDAANKAYVDSLGDRTCSNGQILKYQSGSWTCAGDNSGGGADNLGNHTATQALNMAGNRINNVAHIAVSAVSGVSTYGISAKADITNGRALYGSSTGPSGYGVQGAVSESGVIAVGGYANNAGGTGVWGNATGASGRGVWCQATNNASGCGGNRAWTQSSDGRLKDNITELSADEGLAAIMKLRPVTYQWRTDDMGRIELGFIAQDVENVLPQLVGNNPDVTIKGEDGSERIITDVKALSYSGFVVPLVKAVQELKAENDALKAGLQAANDNFRRELDELKAAICE